MNCALTELPSASVSRLASARHETVALRQIQQQQLKQSGADPCIYGSRFPVGAMTPAGSGRQRAPDQSSKTAGRLPR